MQVNHLRLAGALLLLAVDFQYRQLACEEVPVLLQQQLLLKSIRSLRHDVQIFLPHGLHCHGIGDVMPDEKRELAAFGMEQARIRDVIPSSLEHDCP
ncbi:hypothetical protein PRNP1_004182 [Phytophthora ramorum]